MWIIKWLPLLLISVVNALDWDAPFEENASTTITISEAIELAKKQYIAYYAPPKNGERDIYFGPTESEASINSVAAKKREYVLKRSPTGSLPNNIVNRTINIVDTGTTKVDPSTSSSSGFGY